jgi:dienelactone hydrolase
MRFISVFLIFFASFSSVYAQNELPRVSPSQTGTGPQGREGSYYSEQVWHIPLKNEPGRRIAAILYKGTGNRPLAILTHGTEADPKKNADWRVGLYPHAIEYFIKAGYHVAVVHRRGYGLSGGSPSEKFACVLPNHLLAGDNAANDIISVLDYLARASFIRDKDAIVVGQSTGGWSAVAVAAHNHPKIKAVINFAGGRNGISGKDKSICGLDDLVRDASVFGKKAKTPSLWIYAKNDSLFKEDVVSRMVASYKSGGAPLEFHMLEKFGRDGHSLFPNPNGMKDWGPIVKSFIVNLKP